MPIVSVGPLPARLLLLTATRGELVPARFTDGNRPWLRDFLAEAAAFDGQPFGALARHWRTAPRDPRSGRQLAVARHVLGSWLVRSASAPGSAATRLTAIRGELFAAAASAPRDEALVRVATKHGLDATELTDGLFADLPHARRIAWPQPPLEPSWFGLLANLAITQGMLRHARSAELELDGAARAVLRTAWLHGTPFVVGDETTVRLCWRAARDGHTRGLVAIAPVLPWARRFVLRARCRVRDLDGTFVFATGDPILPSPEPRLFDSELERRFASDWRALATGWQLHREPRPLVVGGRLHFPDFALENALGETWLLEIAGLRDRRVLPHKLAVLAAEPRYLLCLPQRLVPAEITGHPRLVAFGRRGVLAGEVLALVTARGA